MVVVDTRRSRVGGATLEGVFPGGCGRFSGCVTDDVVVDDERRLSSETCK